MKKIFEFVKNHSNQIKETIEYAYLVCLMALMFLGKTGAIISFVSLFVLLIFANIGESTHDDKKDNSENVRKNDTPYRSRENRANYRTVRRAS